MKDTSAFSVHHAKQIIHNLSILIKNKCLLSVHFGEDKAFFLTAILDIDPEKNTIVIDYGPKENLNQQLLKATHIVFQADFAGIKSSFKGSQLTQIIYNGAPAFVMLIPESMHWMQRREYFRVTSPQSKSSFCRVILDDQVSVDLMLYDISLTGFSVMNTSTEISDLFVPGAQFEQCKLVLAESGADDICFEVCFQRIINPNKIAGLKIQKIGCVFTRITPMFETTVQHYINQLQRESIQKTR